jgi:hypothetical protein
MSWSDARAGWRMGALVAVSAVLCAGLMPGTATASSAAPSLVGAHAPARVSSAGPERIEVGLSRSVQADPTASQPNWRTYLSTYNKLPLLADYGCNFAAKATKAIAKANKKALVKHVRTVAGYVAILAQVLAAFGFAHPLIAGITAAVGAVITLLTIKKWAKKVAKIVIWVKKNVFRGKGASNGFYYAFRKNATGEESYIGMTARSCASDADKCGSPGKHIWIETSKDPDPPFGPMTDYCTSGLDCKLK